VPEVLVQKALSWLVERGYDDVHPVSHTDEKLTFALPQELRRELRSRADG
jgi:4-hydroxy-3-methylbut-2-en-1-yl diphosphate reductase